MQRIFASATTTRRTRKSFHAITGKVLLRRRSLKSRTSRGKERDEAAASIRSHSSSPGPSEIFFHDPAWLPLIGFAFEIVESDPQGRGVRGAKWLPVTGARLPLPHQHREALHFTGLL